MRSLLAGQRGRRAIWSRNGARCHLDLHPLAAQQMQTRPPLYPAAPVSPEHRRRGHRERMQEQAHSAGFGGGAPVSLALLRRREPLPRRVAQGAFGLEGKVTSREACD
jgi:hypothetical protein